MRKTYDDDEYCEIDVEVIAQTDKGLLIDDGDNRVWIPKSEVRDDSETYKKGDAGTMILATWIAKEKGLI